KITLAGLIVKLLQKAGQPLTVKQLTEEIQRLKVPTKSANISGMIKARVFELIRKGLLARAPDGSGFVAKSAQKFRVTMSNGAAARRATVSGRKSKAAKSARLGGRVNGQPSLREVLLKVLGQAKQPLNGGELAQKALAAGYRTTSKSFRDLVWANLASMANVEHVYGKGYRLKKR